jgi:hypothetical protein
MLSAIARSQKKNSDFSFCLARSTVELWYLEILTFGFSEKNYESNNNKNKQN